MNYIINYKQSECNDGNNTTMIIPYLSPIPTTGSLVQFKVIITRRYVHNGYSKEDSHESPKKYQLYK